MSLNGKSAIAGWIHMIVKFRHGQAKQRKIDCTRRNFFSDAIETLSNPFQLNPNMLEIYGYSLVSLIQVNPYQPSSTIINHHQPSSPHKMTLSRETLLGGGLGHCLHVKGIFKINKILIFIIVNFLHSPMMSYPNILVFILSNVPCSFV